MSDSAPDMRRAHLKEVPIDAPPDSLGAALRSARLRLSEDYRTVSKELRIRPEYLEALEAGNIAALPGRTYALGFVKTYAHYLGLDVNEAAAKFKAENPSQTPTAETQPLEALPDITSDFRMPQGAVIIIGLVFLLLVFLGVHLFRSASEQMQTRPAPAAPVVVVPDASAPSQMLQQVPQAPAPEASMAPPTSDIVMAEGMPSAALPTEMPAEGVLPAAPTEAQPVTDPALAVSSAAELEDEEGAPPPPESMEEPAGAPLPAEPVAAVEEITPRSGPASEVLPPPPATPATTTPASGVEAAAPAEDSRAQYAQAVAQAPRTYGAATRDNRVVLRAREDVFVRVETEGSRARVLFEGMLGPNQLYFVPAVDDVVLVTRNGGALDVFVDGVSKGPAGPEGVALKGLSLEPQSLN